MIADRIREGIENSTVEVGGINLKVTVSIGFVVVDKPGTGFWSAFEQADSRPLQGEERRAQSRRKGARRAGRTPHEPDTLRNRHRRVTECTPAG